MHATIIVTSMLLKSSLPSNDTVALKVISYKCLEWSSKQKRQGNFALLSNATVSLEGGRDFRSIRVVVTITPNNINYRFYIHLETYNVEDACWI